jgi:hypothetical protein
VTDAVRPSFEALIAPLAPEVFFARHFEQDIAVVHRDRPDFYVPLLSFDAVDRFLTGSAHYYPDVYLVNAAAPDLKPQDYCVADQRIDLRRLYDLFAAGATIVLFGIENRIPALKSLCRALERQFSFACDTNVYLTPGGAHGLRPHYDNHDVFVLQVAGSKSWTTFESSIPLPLPGQSFAVTQTPPGPIAQQFVLNAGDLLYCPRGMMHDAEAGDAVSLHITLGMKGRTWAELMLEAVAEVATADPAFRRMLPVGYAGTAWDRDAARSTFRALADRLVNATDTGVLIDRLADAFVASRPFPVDGQLRRMLDPPAVTPASRFGAWPDLIFRLRTEGDQIRLVWQGLDLTLPSFVAAELAFALTARHFTLGDLPGEMDEAGRIVLIRRLLREGLLRTLPA